MKTKKPSRPQHKAFIGTATGPSNNTPTIFVNPGKPEFPHERPVALLDLREYPAMVEAMAKVLVKRDLRFSGWEYINEGVKDVFRLDARAALKSIGLVAPKKKEAR